MDEHGGNKRCITSRGNRTLGITFPLDRDGRAPGTHWKGDPEAHPTLPVIFFKAENEKSPHKPLLNAPGIGWDNDVWALDLRRKEYYRLTRIAPGQGLQHTAISSDGLWYIYPLRYDRGTPGRDFGFDRMVFCRITTDERGRVRLEKQFDMEPNGKRYYEPNDIHRNAAGLYSLLYAATDGKLCDPYVYEWRDDGDRSSLKCKKLLSTPALHEEFFMFSPSGKKIAWMRGP
jgi:hypothetical protein